MPTPLTAVEIAVQDLDGVRIALSEGADRIELCVALEVGGLTPSIGLIEAAVELAVVAGAEGFVHVLVRPRPGGFVYEPDELTVIERDVRAVAAAGSAGVVIGVSSPDGSLDLESIDRLVDAAQGIAVTVHRAIDVCAEPVAAIEALAGTGVRRVLSSGGAVDCRTGRPILAAMAASSRGGVELMAGGGVRPVDIPALIDAGMDAVHLSARGHSTTGGASGPGGGSPGRAITDRALVRQAIEARASAHS